MVSHLGELITGTRWEKLAHIVSKVITTDGFGVSPGLHGVAEPVAEVTYL